MSSCAREEGPGESTRRLLGGGEAGVSEGSGGLSGLQCKRWLANLDLDSVHVG
jgi:hypothetical protein